MGAPIETVAFARRGVCQDRAHLLIALCRGAGAPARHVSGWRHDPARGVPDESQGWVEVQVPAAGGFEIDPTHPEPITGRWMWVAIGRDYADVTPVRGTHQGAVTTSTTVSIQIGQEAPAPMHPASVTLDHLVDQAVLAGLLGREEAVALGVHVDLLGGLAGVMGKDLVQPCT